MLPKSFNLKINLKLVNFCKYSYRQYFLLIFFIKYLTWFGVLNNYPSIQLIITTIFVKLKINYLYYIYAFEQTKQHDSVFMWYLISRYPTVSLKNCHFNKKSRNCEKKEEREIECLI